MSFKTNNIYNVVIDNNNFSSTYLKLKPYLILLEVPP